MKTKSIFFVLYYVSTLHAMEESREYVTGQRIACGDYRYNTATSTTFKEKTLTLPFELMHKPNNFTFVPEHCVAVLNGCTAKQSKQLAATHPLSPCTGIVVTDYSEEKDYTEESSNYTTIVMHTKPHTRDQEINNWLHKFFGESKTDDLRITLYSYYNNNNIPEYRTLHTQKSQQDRLLERANRIVGGLGVDAEQVTIDLITNTLALDLTNYLAHFLKIDHSQVRLVNDEITVDARVDKKTYEKAYNHAFDLATAPLSLVVDAQGTLYNTLPPAIYNQTQRSILKERSGTQKRLFIKDQQGTIYDILNNTASDIISRHYIDYEKDKSAPMFEIVQSD